MYNTEVGYCQGMSEIAALLLMYLNEEVITVKREKKDILRNFITICYIAVVKCNLLK
jgi:hypothetical protein